MKFAITGSTGFVGSNLISFLEQNGHAAVSVMRKDFVNSDLLAEKLAGADVVVNLAGAPIIARWTKRYMTELAESRVKTTRKLVATLETAHSRPSVLSAVQQSGMKHYTQDKQVLHIAD